MRRALVSMLMAGILIVSMVGSASARPAGVQGSSGGMFDVCRYSIASRLGVSPTDPAVVSYCFAWLFGGIVTPPTH